MSTRSKKSKKFVAIVYALAVIGAWTVAFNVYAVGCSAVNHVKHFVTSIHVQTPVVMTDSSVHHHTHR